MASTVLKVLTRVTRQENEIKDFQGRSKNVLELTHEFNKVLGFKIRIKISCVSKHLQQTT